MLKLVIRHDEPRDDDDDGGDGDDDEDAEAITRAFPRLTLELFHDDGSRRRWRLFYEGAEAQTVAFDTEAAEVGEIVAQPPQWRRGAPFPPTLPLPPRPRPAPLAPQAVVDPRPRRGPGQVRQEVFELR